MKQFTKKIFTGALALVIGLTMTATVFAATSTKSAGKYGTLTGTLTVSSSKITGKTKVTSNPDSAYLVLKMDVQDSSGNALLDPYESYSSDGDTSLSDTSAALPSATYKIFGTHGVQGGSVNPSYAVYTVTTY